MWTSQPNPVWTVWMHRHKIDPRPLQVLHGLTSPSSNNQKDPARFTLSANGEMFHTVKVTPESDSDFPDRIPIQPNTLFPRRQEDYNYFGLSFIPVSSTYPLGGGWGQPVYRNIPTYGIYHQSNHHISSQRQISEPRGIPKSDHFTSGSLFSRKRPLRFPNKLYKIIKDAQAEGKSDIIAFFVHGRAFVIHDPERFSREILPRFFNYTKIITFQRYLNIYGFRRISQGPDSGGYYHPMFVKGRPDLCKYIYKHRKKMRGQNNKVEISDSNRAPLQNYMQSLSDPPHSSLVSLISSLKNCKL